jgi:hypothetical protein
MDAHRAVPHWEDGEDSQPGGGTPQLRPARRNRFADDHEVRKKRLFLVSPSAMELRKAPGDTLVYQLSS